MENKTEQWMINLWKWADDNGIGGHVLPRDSNGLLSIEKLHLHHYKIKELPVEIKELKNLKSIKVNENKLTKVSKELYDDNPSMWAKVYASSLLRLGYEYYENDIEKTIKLELESLKIIKHHFKDAELKFLMEYLRILTELTISYEENNQIVNASALKVESLELREKYCNDKYTMLSLIKSDGNWYDYLSKELENDQDFLLEASKINGYGLKFLSDNFKSNKSVVLDAIRSNGYSISFASKSLQNDKDFLLEAIKINSSVLENTNNNFLDDENFLLSAIKSNIDSVYYIGEKLKATKNVVEVIIRYFNAQDNRYSEEHCLFYDALSNELKNNDEVVYAAVMANGYSLEMAPDRFKSDREFILSLNNAKFYLQFTSSEIKDDKEIALKSFKSDKWSFIAISDRLKNDKDILLASLQQVDEIYEVDEIYDFIAEKMNPSYFADKDIVCAIIGNWYWDSTEIYDKIDKVYLDDKDFILENISRPNCSHILKYINNELQDNKEIVLKAIEDELSSLQYASNRLKQDEEIKNIVIENINNDIDIINNSIDIIPTNTNLESEKVEILSEQLVKLKTMLNEYLSIQLNKKKSNKIVLESLNNYLNKSWKISDRIKDINKALNNE